MSRQQLILESFEAISQRTDGRIYLRYTYAPGDGQRRYIVHGPNGGVTLLGAKEAETFIVAAEMALAAKGGQR